MRRVFKSSGVMFAAISFWAAGSFPVLAQSESRNDPPSGSDSRVAPPVGSGERAARKAPVALEGYCPVSILEMHKWVKGDPAHRVVYDRRTWLFANEQGNRMFQANAAKYVPALGGDCVVALVKMRKRVPGNIRHAAFHDGQLYLFANADAHKMFQAAPATYANADLALGGKCPVCQVNMGQTVAGKPEIAAFHNGLRYLFPAVEQRQTFLANPQKYVSATSRGGRPGSGVSPGQASGGSATRPPAGSGSGTR